VKRFLYYLVLRHIGSQIAMLIVVSLAIANAVTIAVFLMRPPPSSENTIGVLAGLAFTAKLLDAAPPEARADVLRSAKESLSTLVELAELPPHAADVPDIRPVRDLKAVLGDNFKVFVISPQSEGPRPLRIAIGLSDGRLIAADLPVRPPEGAVGLIITVLFLAVVLTLLFLWVGRALTAPLARITDAAEQFSVDRLDTPLPESGPTEVRGLARALNDMRWRIRSLVEDRTHMLAAIGHDLRTPITRLRLRAEEIEQKALQGQIIRDLDILQHLIHSALSFLREKSTSESKHVLVDLPSIVQVLCDGFADMGRPLQFSGPPHLFIHCDPDQVSRAIINLIDNGLKFGSSVSLRIEDLADTVVVEVADDGPGIPEGDREKAIKPFYRGDAARGQTDGSSFGLGLSIANSIIEAHHGKLELGDAAPHGLLARLILPKVASAAH
jgi:signal transduction histidine kinase